MGVTSIWPLLKDLIANLPNRLDNRDYNLADDINESRQFMIKSEKLMGDLTYGGGIATMHALAFDTPIMQVRIGGGAVWFGNNKIEKFAGPYASPTVTAPVSLPRVDLLVLDGAGSFSWVVGTPAGSPVAPAYPLSKYPICEIYVPVGATRIMSGIEDASGSDAYIINRRPIKPLNVLPGGGGHVIRDEGGAALTARTYLNLIGAHVAATDNAGADSTDITIDDLLTVASKSADYTATTDDRLLAFDCTSANKTLTLYTTTGNAGRWLYVIKTDASVNTLTIDPNGAQTINGAATRVLANQYDSVLIACNGSAWHVIASTTGSGGGGGGHVIQDNGTDKTARGKLNFKGATVTDDAGNNATIVDIGAGGGATLAKSVVRNVTGDLPTTADITTASSTFVDMTGMSITMVTNGGDVELVAMFRAGHSNAGSDPFFNFSVDGTDVEAATNGVLGFDEPILTYDMAFHMRWRAVGLSAGSHTFKVRWKASGATAKVRANAAQPAYFWAEELPRNAGVSVLNSGQSGVQVLLNYVEATDLHTNTALGATTWTDVVTKTFNVSGANSKVVISVGGNIMVAANGGVATLARSRIDLDAGAQQIRLGGDRNQSGDLNVLSGAEPIVIEGLSVGTHTIKIQAWSSVASLMNVRALTQVFEGLYINVIEYVNVVSGVLLNHAEVIKNDADFSTSSATLVDVTGLSLTITTNGRPILLAFRAMVNNLSGGTAMVLDIDRSGTKLGNDVDGMWYKSSLGDETANIVHIDRPPAGTYTYKIQMKGVFAGTGKVYADAVNNHADFRAQELPTNDSAYILPTWVMLGHLGGAAIPANSVPNFFFPGFASVDPSEANVLTRMPYNCTVKYFSVNTLNSVGGSGTLVYKVRKNGVDTGIIITIPASTARGEFSDLVNSADFNAGDHLSFVGVNTSGGGGNTLGFSLGVTAR